MRFPFQFLPVTLLVCASALPAVAATRAVPSSQYPTIQSAVDASMPGDTVTVYPGTYRECVVISTKGLKLQGISQGKKLPTLEGAGAAPNTQNGGQNGIEVDADNVTVSGFQVQDYTDGYTLAGIAISNAATFPNNPTGCQIKNNILKNNDLGLYAVSDQTQVSGNTLTGNTSAGAELTGGSNVQFHANDVTGNGQIVNYYDDNGQVIASFPSGTGIYTNSLLNFNLSDNTISNNVNDGVTINFDGGGCVLENNRVSDNGGQGISLYADTGTSVTGNNVSRNVKGIVAIDTTSCTISHNTVSWNLVYGIDLESDDAQNYPSTNTQVAHNEITGNGTAGEASDAGIYLQSVSSCTITNNQINANNANGILFDLLTGYGTSPTTNCSVLNNIANNNLGDGIKLSLGDTGNLIANCTAIGNSPFDAEDDNTAPGANTWRNNKFKKATPNIPAQK